MLTKDQRDVLIANLEQAGSTYDIVTVEYPAHAAGRDDCLKIVTRQIEGDVVDVDFYDFEGTTVENRWFYAREA